MRRTGRNKVHVDPVTSGNALIYIIILYASALTFSNSSLKVACSWVCGLRRLCRKSWLSERTSPLHRVTYKTIVLKEVYLSLLSTPLCSTCCTEHITSSSSSSSAPPCTQHFQKLLFFKRLDWLQGSLRRKHIAWLLCEVKMVHRSQ